MKKKMMFMIASAKQALSMAQVLFNWTESVLPDDTPRYPKGPRFR